MTQNTELRQLQNTVEIVGTLKSKELQVKVSKKGNQYITGKLVVQSKFDNKINEISVKVFIMATSKLFKGAETVMNEYKSIESHGAEADRVRITGELDLNEYYNGQGKLVQFNEVKGVFFNRLDMTNDQPDKAIASIETVVEEFTPILDSSQLPTGDYKVKGFTVAWGNNVIELQNAVVSSELAQMFMSLYTPNTTGRLTYKINNYVEIKENEAPAQTATHGFGSTETVEANEIKNYVSNIEVIGGDQPFFGTKEYTPQEIEIAHQVRSLKLIELQAPAAPTPPVTNTGFGQGAPTPQQIENQLPTGMGNNEMPDF